MQFITVDVFTDTPFLGNPLAVVIVEDKERAALGKDKQQLIAKEFNLCKHYSSPSTAPVGHVSECSRMHRFRTRSK